MSKGHQLTLEEKEKIRALSGGMLQKHIASRLNISVHFVRNAQREFGLLPHSTEPLSAEMKRKVLDLFGEGHGSPYIAKALDLPQHRVEQVREEFRFRHPEGIVGHRYYLTTEKKRAIRRAIRTSERKIAKDFGVSREWLSKFRHLLWKPQKKAQKKNSHAKNKIGVSQRDMTSLALQLVDKICTGFLGGALPTPANEHRFVQGLSVVVIPEQGSPDLNQCDREDVRNNFEAHLHQAIATLRAAEAAQSTDLVN